MSRDEAASEVAGVTETVNGFSAVSHEHAKNLLGVERFNLMLQDPVRRLGPTKATVYPWNVIDYLTITLPAPSKLHAKEAEPNTR